MVPKADDDSYWEFLEDLKRRLGFDEYVASLLAAEGCKPHGTLVQQVKRKVNPKVAEATR